MLVDHTTLEDFIESRRMRLDDEGLADVALCNVKRGYLGRQTVHHRNHKASARLWVDRDHVPVDIPGPNSDRSVVELDLKG